MFVLLLIIIIYQGLSYSNPVVLKGRDNGIDCIMAVQ